MSIQHDRPKIAIERKSQSNQSNNAIERNRIIAIQLSNVIESQLNGQFILGNIRFRSIEILRLIGRLRSIGSIDCRFDWLSCIPR